MCLEYICVGVGDVVSNLGWKGELVLDVDGFWCLVKEFRRFESGWKLLLGY